MKCPSCLRIASKFACELTIIHSGLVAAGNNTSQSAVSYIGDCYVCKSAMNGAFLSTNIRMDLTLQSLN